MDKEQTLRMDQYRDTIVSEVHRTIGYIQAYRMAIHEGAKRTARITGMNMIDSKSELNRVMFNLRHNMPEELNPTVKVWIDRANSQIQTIDALLEKGNV